MEEDRSLLARVLVYGDIHLSSKNYGGHRQYPMESLGYFRNITNTAKEFEVTHIVGLGDLTYGRFHTLEYRQAVETEFIEQNKICNGNRYELKGNHDSATYGMTEYEYFKARGLFRASTNLSIGNLNLSMIDYGKHRQSKILNVEKEKTNIVLMHDYFKFEDTRIADYGKALILDSFEPWFGVDYIVGGHIHNHELFEGKMISNGMSYKTIVHYLGCPCRPAYRPGFMQETGQYAIISVYQNGEVDYDIHEFPLLGINESFNLEEKAEKEEHLAQKRVDVSDIVHRLDNHKRVVGEPEEIIMAMEDIKLEYRKKAVELLKDCLA